ncbi:malonyl CoA-acyl carrier protein transacylase [Tistlia consotensis]|uniref:[acyl-carrier-protein] S-malonyltransferase n=1 Tax=Tistlia consotensis USBA 355 TaxID=560819 RepID=A0A1Y6C920_9PROT|nr:ACP S-malonyltransferase [Tistlia consotensis]SMF48872.1 malonyl CoA-acyl carrier protein transacylase [Tistlia consotensis USBA 355]SNR80685.1 malonyl CoA-acyl carrier protein transacylase [Tistlia consotensis]
MKAYLFPGQGSQRVGMGEGLFEAFPELTAAADEILGLSIRQLCLEDPQRRLGRTQYTQPALYVVNALTRRRHQQETGERPDFVAGHSLGEYDALECAGVLGFEDGLRLVRKRGELMSTAPKGRMAAVIGLEAGKVAEVLAENGLEAIDVANYNAAEQIIISGLDADIERAQASFERAEATYIPLNVGGAFHSRYMRPVLEDFSAFVEGFAFAEPQIPVIANVDALPYRPGEAARTLSEQLTHSVRWLDGMTYMLRQGVTDFIELGPGDVLTKLARTIKASFRPGAAPAPAAPPDAEPAPARDPGDPQQKVADWNRAYPVGTRVRVPGHREPLTTKSQAVVLFGHRAAVYLQGYNGYFALDEVEPAAG